MEPLQADQHYRCNACGNLTRFDVTVTLRKRYYHHADLGGVVTVEDEQVLDETVEEVICRWCGSGKEVEVQTGGVIQGQDAD